ncbi:hypothetical protein Afil01_44590 [Actinorhabdospora filicis]|uniref:Uncharacterized protein n=1 Tax=Actinorhabdospora filicis TaxID=1785913 RepID=A0A9W6SPS8_9ACTN|nr:hypothetical protein [Actinorhabdospora filicis]GLZ79652.1 hypothetical protein Afil01_44590 [Actinorhabdospora filicis]
MKPDNRETESGVHLARLSRIPIIVGRMETPGECDRQFPAGELNIPNAAYGMTATAVPISTGAPLPFSATIPTNPASSQVHP